MRQLSPSLFSGRHFDCAIIILCVRWYITYKLSYRDLVEMMAERGVGISHTTVLRWVQRSVPEFEKRRRRYARLVGTSWRVDETHTSVRGRWTYLLPRRRSAGPDSRFPARRAQGHCRSKA